MLQIGFGATAMTAEISQATRALAGEANRMQQDMLLALAEERWEDMQALDRRCRELYANIDHGTLSAADAALLADSMRNFLEFHRELSQAVEVFRDNAGDELRRLRAGRKGTDTYRSVGD